MVKAKNTKAIRMYCINTGLIKYGDMFLKYVFQQVLTIILRSERVEQGLIYTAFKKKV